MVRQPDGSFLADARASLEDVAAFVGPEFDVGEAAEEVDTLGGYLATQIGRVPVRGELVPGPGPFEIEVLDADPRRVKRLRIYRSTDRPDRRKADQRRAARGSQSRQRPAAGASGAAPAPPPLPVTRDASVKLSPDDRAAEVFAPAVTLTRLAHCVVLAWGWRRVADRVRRRRRVDAGAAAVRRLAGRCS